MSAAPRSLLDIQSEQENERRQQQRPNRGGGGMYRGGFGGGNRGGRGSRGGRGRAGIDTSSMPLEEGVVCSLKDNFGFIHCADRPIDLFFHFSQVQGKHPAIDDPVEFRVGTNSRDSEKLAAYQVRQLDKPIVWETPEVPRDRRFRGIVERATRFDRGSTVDGTIRMLIEKKQEDSDEVVDVPVGPLVRFGNADYQPQTQQVRQPNRLSRGDLVEFTMTTLRRTKEKYARNIALLLSERERARQEQERKMMEEATLEHGVVTALKGEYGFLRSNKRREEVYFHYSSVDLKAEGEEKEGGELVLKEGQDMKFLVVNEVSDGSGGPPGQQPMKRRVSARQVQMQPRGSVKFHDALACGVTGIVTLCPQPVDSGHSLEARGKVQLTDPLTDTDPETGKERRISEVYLSSKDSPGGIFSFRGGSAAACWVQLGDTLLFDVVRDYVDAACHAAPTRHEMPNPNPFELETEEDESLGTKKRRVRLIDMSLVARAEGVVNAVKESYGFIHFAERPVDVHFKLFQLLPDELQADVRRSKGLRNVDANGEPLKLNVGAEVQFDISVHGTIHAHQGASNGGRNNRGGSRNQNQERENLKAQRILLLPPNTVLSSKVLAQGIRGKVSKEDPKQPFAGMVDLVDPDVKHMTVEERHPLVASMVQSYISNAKLTAPLLFHDIQSPREEDVIVDMIEQKARGKLEWSHIPQEAEPNYPGILCIRKVEGDGLDAKPSSGTDENEQPVEPECKTGEKDPVVDVSKPPEEISENQQVNRSSKKKKLSKLIKSIRFDKSSLSKDLKESLIPPALGDLVEFDVVQSRRTGQVAVERLKMVERQRKVPKSADEATAMMGVVKEISRNFGFIAVLNYDGVIVSNTRKDWVFFSLSNVAVLGSAPATTYGRSRSKSPTRHDHQRLQKGDRVRFELGSEKNGKKVALNVTLVEAAAMTDKELPGNVCRGYVLLEPSHTSLTGALPAKSAGLDKNKVAGGGRWENAADDNVPPAENSKEQGVILLWEDPTCMFSSHESGDVVEGAAKAGVAVRSEEPNVAARRHLRYKSTALAESVDNPKRGDLVSFVKVRGTSSGVRDIRVVAAGAATYVRGRLEEIKLSSLSSGASTPADRAKFVVSTGGQEVSYDADLQEVVSCELSVLKDGQEVEGILQDGKIYGICRTTDLYLSSSKSSGGNRTERPKLNLTVKKDRAGTIMAQSMMAKGPDGTYGFAPGWTPRASRFVGSG